MRKAVFALVFLVVAVGFSGLQSRTQAGSVSAQAAAWPLWHEDPAMTYDTQSHRMVMFGGLYYQEAWINDTWTYDVGANAWTEREPVPHPPPLRYPSAAYDSLSDRVLLVGGTNLPTEPSYETETWSYDLDADLWQNLTSATGPRVSGDIAYDARADVTIFFGAGQTWAYAYATNTWVNKTGPVGPHVGNGAAVVYDSSADSLVVYGGALPGAEASNETWAYDYAGNVWTNRTPESGPPGLYGMAMTYDSRASRAILFGGFTGLPDLYLSGETWAYDFQANRWTALDPATAPPPRTDHGMTFDPTSGEVLLFGGQQTAIHRTEYYDLWAYHSDNNTWTQVFPAAESPPSWLGLPPEVASALGYSLAAVGVTAIVLGALWLVRRRRRARGTGPPATQPPTTPPRP